VRAWVGAFVLMAALTSPVLAGSEEDALQVVEKWAAAFNASDVDAITGLDATTAVRDGKTITSPGRVTFVVARRGPEWKIVHFHRSAVPGRPN
jgi:ketosteroid isomerase-like protein